MNLFKKSFLMLSIATLFASCSDETGTVDALPLGAYENGVLVLNQGNFGQGNATISYLSNDLNTFQNNIFALVNPTIILGDTAQDIGFNNDLAYIVLNVSNKIQIANRYTLKSVATISTGLTNPRYIAFANGKAYVTCWGNATSTSDDYVAVINLTTNAVTATISVVEGPERILENNGKLYVAQKGGYGYGNKITVINAATNAVSNTITVGDVPESMRIVGTTLYVICSGNPSYATPLPETAGKFVKVDLATSAVTSSIAFATTEHPANLDFYNNEFYYTVDEKVFKTTAASTALPTTPLFSTTPQGAYGIYSFEVENNKIYLGDAGNYISNGKIYVYSLAGTLQNTRTVGLIPAGFYFN